MITRVEHCFAADIRQAKTIAVATNTRNNATKNAWGVGVCWVTESQGIHDRKWASTHRKNVTHDATNSRGGTLIGLNK